MSADLQILTPGHWFSRPNQKSPAHSTGNHKRQSLKQLVQLVIEHTQRGADGHVHLQVLVGAQASAEEHLALVGLLVGQLAVCLLYTSDAADDVYQV